MRYQLLIPTCRRFYNIQWLRAVFFKIMLKCIIWIMSDSDESRNHSVTDAFRLTEIETICENKRGKIYGFYRYK